jgi:hypothetical protein
MNRARIALAATLVSTTVFGLGILGAGIVAAQSAPPMQSVLAGKKLTPPLKGEALIEFTQPVTKAVPGKNMVQTVIKVKNASLSPVARLQITETWFDKAGGVVAGGRAGVNGLLQPGDVQVITIDTPYNTKMSSNSWNFTHANGTVKTQKVAKLDVPAAAAAPAGAKPPTK